MMVEVFESAKIIDLVWGLTGGEMDGDEYLGLRVRVGQMVSEVVEELVGADRKDVIKLWETIFLKLVRIRYWILKHTDYWRFYKIRKGVKRFSGEVDFVLQIIEKLLDYYTQKQQVLRQDVEAIKRHIIDDRVLDRARWLLHDHVMIWFEEPGTWTGVGWGMGDVYDVEREEDVSETCYYEVISIQDFVKWCKEQGHVLGPVSRQLLELERPAYVVAICDNLGDPVRVRGLDVERAFFASYVLNGCLTILRGKIIFDFTRWGLPEKLEKYLLEKRNLEQS